MPKGKMEIKGLVLKICNFSGYYIVGDLSSAHKVLTRRAAVVATTGYPGVKKKIQCKHNNYTIYNIVYIQYISMYTIYPM